MSGGWGRGKVVNESTEFCTFSSCQEAAVKKQQSLAAIGFHGTLLQSSSFCPLNC